MDVEDSKYFGLCKCCLRDGCFRSLWVEYAVGGVLHNYGEMINECFALNWEKPDNDLLDQICDRCTRRLKDAHSFRKQVLASHHQLNNLKQEENESEVIGDEIYENVLVLDEIKTEETYIEDDPNKITIEYSNDPAEYLNDPNEPNYYSNDSTVYPNDPNDYPDEHNDPNDYPDDPNDPIDNPDDHNDPTDFADDCNDPIDYPNDPINPTDFVDDPDDPDYQVDPQDAQDSDNVDYLDDADGSQDGVKEEYEEVEYLEFDADAQETVAAPALPAPPQAKKKRRGGRRVYKNYTIDDLKQSVEAARSGRMTAAEAAARFNVPRKTIAAKILSEKRGELPKPTVVMMNRNRYFRLIDEVKLLLTYTNATPYKTKTAHYHCAYCSTTGPLFEDPDELRTHTRTLHAGERTSSVEQFLRPLWLNEVLKVDIENLHCTVCCTILISWNDMFQHLKEKHDLDFDDAYTRVIPYLLTRELKCALCKEPFPNYHHLDSHMNAHYNNYMCSECGDTFLSETRLKKHLKIHNTGKYRCECGKTFTLEKYRKKHIELVHKQELNIKCLYCPEKFIGTYPRHLHVLQHHREKVSIITCELCGKTFDWRPYYLVHVRRKHNNEKNHTCEICKVQFFLKSELTRHRATHKEKKFVYVTKFKELSDETTVDAEPGAQTAAASAEDDRPQEAQGSAKIPEHLLHTFTICDKSFLQETRLKSPICAQVTLPTNYATSDKTNNYFCDNCGSKFSSKADLIQHLQRYEQEPYFCKVCEKLFTNINALNNHKHHHYSCSICRIEFNNKDSFTKHKIIHSNEKPYSCDICNKAFKRRGSLPKHLDAHNKRNMHICDICNQSFSSQSKLNQHVLKYMGSQPHRCEICKKQFHSHPDIKPYACETCTNSLRAPQDLKDSVKFDCFVCKKSYKNLQRFYEHMQIHTNVKTACNVCNKEFTRNKLRRHMLTHKVKPFPCDVCTKGFKDRRSLAEHKGIHSGVKPHRCDICNKQFRRLQTFNEHMLHHSHPDGKPYVCKICSKAWKSRMGLRAHMECHAGAKFICDVCKKQYTHRTALIRHLQNHLKVKYVCDICKKSFVRRAFLSSHMFTHTRIKQYCCEMCGERFRYPKALEDHKLRHSLPKNSTFACDVCNRSYKTRCYLHVHKQTHSEAIFVCDVCKKSFKLRNSLVTHLRIHSGVKPYSCDVCKKRFLRRDNFTQHLLIHTDEKLYMCHICSKQFRTHKRLRAHSLSHSRVRGTHACDICNKTYMKPRFLWRHKLTHSEANLICDVCKNTFRQRSILIEHMKSHFGN